MIIPEKKDRNQTEESVILTADIGATNTRYWLVAVTKELSSWKKLMVKKYPSGTVADFRKQLAALLAELKSEYGIERPQAAVIGIAGKIAGDRKSCRPTFLNWGEVMMADELVRWGIEPIFLMNDLEAGVYGVNLALPSKFIQLATTTFTVTSGENYRFILGVPGSGFGHGYRERDGLARPSEGGGRAIAVSPVDIMEQQILMSLYLEINNGDETDLGVLPSYDYLVSGPGIRRIKDIVLYQPQYADCVSKVVDRINNLPMADQPAQISALAMAGDKLCTRVMEIFCRFFARAMQGIALFTLPDVVYLAGPDAGVRAIRIGPTTI